MSDGNHSPGTHTGRRLAGDSAWHQAHHDQSTSSPSTAVAHDGHGASRVVDVGGRGSRTRTNLKNPSTSAPAQSSPLQVHQRTRGPTTDGAAANWSLDFPPTSAAPALYGSAKAFYVVPTNRAHMKKKHTQKYVRPAEGGMGESSARVDGSNLERSNVRMHST